MTEGPETRAPSPRELKALIEAERTGAPFVFWRDGAGEQQILALGPERAKVTVGRRDNCDIALTWDPEVSRVHATLESVGDEWTLVDDGLSRNGSFVNGHQIRGRTRLHNKDHMCFGRTYVYFREPSQAHASASTARASETPATLPLSEAQRKVLVALCRPVVHSTSAIPATNPQIAQEVFMSVDAVKAHLRILFDRFGLADLPQNEKRTRLVAIVRESGLLPPHVF